MEYIDGFLLPDDFIKKYTKFSSFSEFKKIAKKHGIKILKSKYEEEFTDKSTRRTVHYLIINVSFFKT